jgi:2-C-methyl-D-erythritol 2,4-cyclodiphosphate synthase
MDTRIGFGWDSHAFKPGVPLRIGGMSIEHPEGLAGHSDGDVLLHAITDALLGAEYPRQSRGLDYVSRSKRLERGR